MRLQGWAILGMLAFPALAPAQTVKEADVVGAWQAELEHADREGKSRGWLVLWPDGLWWYGGAFGTDNHGGAQWRLVGDTLWLANDYLLYSMWHQIIAPRFHALKARYGDPGIIDMEAIRNRPSFPVPDSVYWSNAFRDSTTACAKGVQGFGVCGTWVYKVSMRDQQLSLVRLDSLSRATQHVATKAVLKRDPLVECAPVAACP